MGTIFKGLFIFALVTLFITVSTTVYMICITARDNSRPDQNIHIDYSKFTKEKINHERKSQD